MPPIPFGSWTINDAREAAALDADTKAAVKATRDFYLGEHWQGNEGWVGPWPALPERADPATVAALQDLQQEIRRGFTPRNAIREVIHRHRDGVVSRPVSWYAAKRGARPANATQKQPSEAEQRAARELEAPVIEWWDRERVQTKLQDFVVRILYGTRATLRLRIPSALLETVPTEGGGTRRQLRVANYEDALRKITLDVVDADAGRVVRHDATQLDVGVLVTSQDGQERVDLTYVDENGQTVLRVIGGDGAGTIAFDLGRRLTMHTAERPEFITPSVRQHQRTLNYANSMIPRNLTTAGFMSQTILNAQVPGRKVTDPDTGVSTFVPDPILRGPGVVNMLAGIKTEGPNGGDVLTSPSIHTDQPVSPEPTIKGKREHLRDIYEETNQGHILIVGDATPSGISREQARDDYIKSLGTTAERVESATQWVLETVVAWAEALARQPLQRMGEWKFVAKCLIDPGALSGEERTANREDVRSRILARGTAMERAGVLDPDAEMERLVAEEGDDLDRETKRAAVFTAWVNAGVSEEAAARRAGLSEEEARTLLQAPRDVTPPTPAPARAEQTPPPAAEPEETPRAA